MRFKVTHEVTVELEIDDKVIKEATSEEWKKSFYDLKTPEDVAEHIAYNAVANDIRDVTVLDGFAHLDKDSVKYIKFDYYFTLAEATEDKADETEKEPAI